MDDPWSRQKDYWLSHRATAEQILATIAMLYDRANGEPPELDTILWLSSRGRYGQDVSGSDTLDSAVKVGGFTLRPNDAGGCHERW